MKPKRMLEKPAIAAVAVMRSSLTSSWMSASPGLFMFRCAIAQLTVIAQLPLRLVLAISLQVDRVLAKTSIAAVGKNGGLLILRILAQYNCGRSNSH